MENRSFSVKDSAGKSFRTFVLTLSISLIVFSTVYYLMTSSSSSSDSLDGSLGSIGRVSQSDQPSVKGESDSQKSVFKEIADTDPGTTPRQVLAGATEVTTQQTTQSTTSLDTGVTSITVGLFSALALFIVALFIVHNNPRRLALTSFEKNTVRDLE